jgi:hypothetical protein
LDAFFPATLDIDHLVAYTQTNDDPALLKIGDEVGVHRDDSRQDRVRILRGPLNLVGAIYDAWSEFDTGSLQQLLLKRKISVSRIQIANLHLTFQRKRLAGVFVARPDGGECDRRSFSFGIAGQALVILFAV